MPNLQNMKMVMKDLENQIIHLKIDVFDMGDPDDDDEDSENKEYITGYRRRRFQNSKL